MKNLVSVSILGCAMGFLTTGCSSGSGATSNDGSVDGSHDAMVTDTGSATDSKVDSATTTDSATDTGTAIDTGTVADAKADTATDTGIPCTPSCTNKTCGSDGCGGTCGGCPPTKMCSSSGSCQTPSGTGITVDTHSQLTPISPDIYGVAFATDTGDDSYKVSTLDRWGGDSTTSYNWKNDLHNSGGDWMCANYSGGGTSCDTFVQTNKTRGLDTLMTIPITGWLSSVLTSSDTTYSAAIANTLSDCNWPLTAPGGGTLDSKTCCAAIGTKESTLVDKGSNALDTSFTSGWLSHLVSTFGTAASGGIKYYQLDNEPDNWQGLRQDVYPSLYPPGNSCMDYSVKISSGNESGVSPNDDIINRSIAYAAAVKTADPTAQVLFLSVMSPDDTINLLHDECGVGQSWGTQFAVPYTIDNSYAMAMMAKGKQYEAANHKRIFDCLDTHYPGDAQSMWTNTVSHFQGWINSTYPGTAICVSEYNVANDTTDRTATTKEADYLGMFGVMGFRVASYWTTLAPKDSSNNYVHSYSYPAFAMFRDYDGAGGTFGSTSVGAASSYANVHAYASTDAATNPTKLWIMLVNTGTTDQTNMTVQINNFTAAATAKVYQSVNGAAPAAGTNVGIAGGAISGVSVAANSVALIAVTH